MKPTIPALLLVGLLACGNGPDAKVQLDPREAKEIAKALEGKVAGKPVNCVPTFSGTNLRAAGDHVLLYRANSRVTYRNDLVGVCRGLRQGDTLVIKMFGSQYCRGDIAHAVNLPSGMMTGSCSLGEFVPYTTPDAG